MASLYQKRKKKKSVTKVKISLKLIYFKLTKTF